MDRLIAVLKPVRHKVYLSRRRLYVYIAVLWIFAVLITALLQILDEFTDTFTGNRLVSRMLGQTFETTPFSNLRTSSEFALLTASPRNNLVTVIEKKKTFQNDMQFALSVMIIIADVFIVSSYSLINYVTTFKIKTVSSTRKHSNKLSVICIAIAGAFVLLTLPYAVTRLAFGDVTFVPNFVLALNSGMNSIVYFFRLKISSYCQNKKEKVALNGKLKARTPPGSTPEPPFLEANDENATF